MKISDTNSSYPEEVAFSLLPGRSWEAAVQLIAGFRRARLQRGKIVSPEASEIRRWFVAVSEWPASIGNIRVIFGGVIGNNGKLNGNYYIVQPCCGLFWGFPS